MFTMFRYTGYVQVFTDGSNNRQHCFCSCSPYSDRAAICKLTSNCFSVYTVDLNAICMAGLNKQNHIPCHVPETVEHELPYRVHPNSLELCLLIAWREPREEGRNEEICLKRTEPSFPRKRHVKRRLCLMMVAADPSSISCQSA